MKSSDPGPALPPDYLDSVRLAGFRTPLVTIFKTPGSIPYGDCDPNVLLNKPDDMTIRLSTGLVNFSRKQLWAPIPEGYDRLPSPKRR